MLDNIFQQKQYGPETKAMTSEFFVKVYTYMFIALGISGSIAYLFGTDHSLINYLVKVDIQTQTIRHTPLFYIATFAPLVFILLINFAYKRFSMPLLFIFFAAFSVFMGLSLSSIFLVYTLGSILTTFLVTSLSFGAMAVLGYTTKTDLTKFGSLLYMALFGMIIAMLVNLFMNSDTASYVISIIGVFVFTGLTAFKMQYLKYIAEDPQLSQLDRSKLSLIGGLSLYMTFINLFLSLLRLFGSRD